MKNILFKKYLPLIIMAIILISMILIAWFGIIPFHKFIVEKADDIQKFYTIRENRQRQINKLPELESQFDLIVAEEKKLDVILPENRIVDFVKILETLAAETRTEIVIQSPDKGAIQDKNSIKKSTKKSADTEKSDASEKTTPTLFESLPYERFLRVNITVRGEYRDIVTFLQKMETLPYALDVVGVQMKVRQEDDDRRNNSPDPKNPFLLSPGATLSSPTLGEASEPEVPQGRIEAVFDTVVYVNKE